MFKIYANVSNLNYTNSPINLPANLTKKYTPKAISFGARLTPEIRTAEKILLEFSRKGYQSATYLERLMLKNTVPDSYLAPKLFMHKYSCFNHIITIYRHFLQNITKFSSEQEFINTQRKIIEKIKVLNCYEASLIAIDELKKKNIPCRFVVDKRIDHDIVIVNRKKPFTRYSDGEKGEFVLDLWQKKLYKSTNEAFVDLKNQFGAKYNQELEDMTDKCKNYTGYPNMNFFARIKNKYLNWIKLNVLIKHQKRMLAVAHEQEQAMLKNNRTEALNEIVNEDKRIAYAQNLIEATHAAEKKRKRWWR